MKRPVLRLGAEEFDVCVVGGGILGAGIARDAALRGLRVALIEKGDFASGTSSRSTKLVHGGLRYLEQRAFGLVAESCRERGILHDMAPHLVSPLSLLLPVYQSDPRSLTLIRLGATVYDWIAFRRQGRMPRHRSLSAEETLSEEPALPRANLRGAVLYHDCQMDDARLCLETALDAAHHGAAVANYCAVTGFRREGERIATARVADGMSGEEGEVRAKIFVNATGPWIEQVARLAGVDGAAVALSPTKGVHLVLPRLLKEHAVYFQARESRRMLFLIPWGDSTLLGTTDTEFTGDPDQATAEPADVDYLLEELGLLMPSSAITRPDVITSFAGVRALLQSGEQSPSARSREERIVRHGANLLSVVGGKYTTFRSIADRVVRRLFEMLGQRKSPPCRTASTPLPDRLPEPAGERLCTMPLVHASDIRHACEQEMAMTVSDVMRRRTQLALGRGGAPDTALAVSRVMAACLGWDDATRERHVQAYVAEWTRSQV
jgi:glycerol-3-phosphate dehydrogenase